MNFSTARVRPMVSADLGRVMEIAASLPEAPDWPRAAYQAALDPAASPRRIALVIEDIALGSVAASGKLYAPPSNRVTGFAVASLLPPEAELEIIAVDPGFQRRGHACQLFAALTAALAEAAIAEIDLEVRASNQPALGLYRKLGFVETGRRVRYYQNPAEDAVRMRLRF